MDDTPALGRHIPLRELEDWTREQRGLMQVCGVAGVGKSYVLRALKNALPAATWVSLSQVSSTAHAVARIADAATLTLPEATPESLATVLARDTTPLILDDLDALTHPLSLLEALAELPRPVLFSARGEFDVGGASLRLGPLDEAAALALLVRELPGLDAEDPALLMLIEALDALPLALQLVAQKLRALPARRLLERLEQRSSLLGQGPLARALSMSVETLEASEREVLRACAVFREGFDLEAARAILPRGATAALEALVQASLLERDETGRFQMLWSVHGVLNASVPESLAIAHATYYSGLMLEVERVTPVLLREETNLLAACERGLEPILHAKCVLAYRRIGVAKGPYDALLCLVLEAIERFPAETDALEYAELYGRAGELYRVLGDFASSRQYLERGIEVFGDRVVSLSGGLYSALSYTHLHEGDFAEAMRAAEIARAHYHELGDMVGWAHGTLALASVAIRSDALERALTLIHEVLEHEPNSKSAHNNLGSVYLLLHDPAGARRHLERSRALSLEALDSKSLLHATGNLIKVELWEGHMDRAQVLFEEQCDLLEQLHLNRLRGAVGLNRALFAWIRGDLEAARDEYLDAQRQSHQYGSLGMAKAGQARHLAIRALLGERVEPLADLPSEDASFLEAALAVAGYQEEGGDEAYERARRRLEASPEDLPARVLWRQLERHLEAARGLEVAQNETYVLWVREGFSSVSVDGERWISLSRRANARRLLEALSQAYPSDLDAWSLFERVWPDVAIHGTTTLGRLYTCVYRLRTFGLEDVVVHTGESYRLAGPACVVES